MDKIAGLLGKKIVNPLRLEVGFLFKGNEEIMNIAGSYFYNNQISNLISTIGVKPSTGFSEQVIISAVASIQNKISNQIFSAESAQVLGNFYNNVVDLANQAQKLTLAASNSVFNDRTAKSSDTNILTATAYDALSSVTGASESTYQISITQLALSQENEGNDLNETDTSVVPIGTNIFNISIDGNDFELSIDVTAGDTNADVLEKMTMAINDANLGITANVTSGSSANTKKITIASNSTGAVNGFSISDVSGSAVTAMGADIITTIAQDSAYVVDGMEYSSESNTVYLDNSMVTVNLLGVGDVDLTIAPDADTVDNAISNFVSELNSSIDFLQNNGDYINDDVLETINSFISDHKSELESFGIQKNSDGKLEIDQEKLSEAIAQNFGGIKDTFAGVNGFSIQIDNLSNRIKSSPASDYSKEFESSDYSKLFYSNLQNVNQNSIQGMLLDILI